MRLLEPVFRNLDSYRAENWLPDDGRHVSFTVSGGRSSAYQLWHVLKANPDWRERGWFFNFDNTGLELGETLVFIDRLDRYFNLGLAWLEFDTREPSLVRRVDFATASRNAEPFEMLLQQRLLRKDGTVGRRPLPNPTARSCTANLKTKTAHRYVRKHLGWPTDYYCVLGYRADESARALKKQARDAKGRQEGGWGLFPMFHAGADSTDVERFWMHAPFDLELDSAYGNCDFCFMVSTWKLKERMLLEALSGQARIGPGASAPPRLQRWIDWENYALSDACDRRGPFRLKRPTYAQLWAEVCGGNMQSSVPENVNDVCRACTD